MWLWPWYYKLSCWTLLPPAVYSCITNKSIWFQVLHWNKCWEKKEKIWLSPKTKAPTPTEKSKKQRHNTKNFDYTRLWTDLGRSIGVTRTTLMGRLLSLAHTCTQKTQTYLDEIIFWHTLYNKTSAHRSSLTFLPQHCYNLHFWIIIFRAWKGIWNYLRCVFFIF